MTQALIIRNFAGGELGPSLYARADVVKYQTGARTVRNMLVMRHGGVQNRTGSKFIREVKDSDVRTVLRKFVFNDDQAYLLELGERYVRFYRNGVRLDITGDVIAPWDAITTWSVGALVQDLGLYYYCILGNTNHQPPNATYWFPLTGTIYEIPSDYIEGELPKLKTVQSADVLTIVQHDAQPSELSRTDEHSWFLSQISFTPSFVAPGGPPSATSLVAGSTIWRYQVTSVREETYEESAPSVTFFCTGGTPTDTAPNDLQWFPATGAVQYNVYKEVVPGNGVFGFIGVAAGPGFNDPNITPNVAVTPPILRDPFSGSLDKPGAVSYYQQRLVFAGTMSQPETVEASRISQFKNFCISSPVRDDDAVKFTINSNRVQDIRHLIDVDRLVILTSGGIWVTYGDQDGALLPGSGVVNCRKRVDGGVADVIPVVVVSTIIYVQARGSIVRGINFNDIPQGPSIPGLVQAKDLTVYAPHLFTGYQIEAMDYAESPHSIVWCVRSDGTLLGLTYMPDQEIWGWHHHDTDGVYEDVCTIPEGDEDAVYVIVRRNIGGVEKRYIERFASRRVTDPRLDALFLDSYLSYDGRNQTAMTMRLSATGGWTHAHEITVTASDLFFSAGDINNAIEIATLDAEGVEYRVRVTIYSYISETVVKGYSDRDIASPLREVSLRTWGKCVDRITGLAHLQGKTVGILADGGVQAEQVVSGGTVTLNRPYMIVHVGLPITADFETLDMDAAGQQLRDRKKRVASVDLIVEASRGGLVGPDSASLTEMAGLVTDYRLPQALYTGMVSVDILSEWNDTGRIFVRQDKPLPLTILAAIPQTEFGG